MTRPKAPKSKSRAATAAVQPDQSPAPTPAQLQQLQAQQLAQQPAAAKKRPAEAAAPPPAGAGMAAPAAVGEQLEVDQLERKRMQVAEELRQVEKQIFDLETNYFQISSAMGNAIRGYEGFLGGSKKSAAAPVQPEERLFSWSSVTGQLGCGVPAE